MSRLKAEMSVEQKENGQIVEYVAYPYVEYDHVTMENGMDIMSMIRDDVSTPMVTHNTTSWKAGQGDSDVSDSIVDSSVASMSIKGQTYQNILPNPSLRNSMTNGKTMQKLNEGYDSVNTVDGVCKSAILSGNTLVNIPTTYNRNPSSNGNVMVETTNLSMLKSNTKYLLKIINKSNYDITYYPNASSFIGNDFTVNGKSEGYVILTSLDATLTHNGIVRLRSSSETIIDLECAILFIEYKDGMENWDIPYFEGMQSVKMPVLTTTGKNLFDGEGLYATVKGGVATGSLRLLINGLKIKKKTDYIISFKYETDTDRPVSSYCVLSKINQSLDNHNNLYVFNQNNSSNGNSLNTSSLQFNSGDFEYLYLSASSTTSTTDGYISYSDIQVEEGSTATSYEPYKSNILTTPQDVVLRKIGDVEDTLDLITGECVQRIGEVVLDGSKEWKLRGMTTDVIVFSIDDIGINSFTDFTNSHKKMLCDKFVCGYYENNNIEFTCCRASGKGLLIGVLKTKLETQDTVGLKQYLSTNNVTIQYQLETESVKTVDLSVLDQDNQPVTQLNSFANGHIQASSQGLIPSVDYEVPTSNSYYLDLAKPSTQYTMKNMIGTFTLDGTQYNASTNGTFTSPSALTNKFMITNVVQTQPMLLEGDMTSEEVPYVEGIKSAFEGADKVEIVSQNADNTLSNTTSFQLSNPLRSLPNGVRDEIVLDRVNHKAKIIQRVGEDLTQLDTPNVTEVNLEGYPYVYKDGYIFLNTEIAPTTEVTYSINQAHQIESSNEDILRHQKEINHLYELIAQYVQVQYEAELIDIALQG